MEKCDHTNNNLWVKAETHFVEGEITFVKVSKKKEFVIYGYSYIVDNVDYKGSFRMVKKYGGVQQRSPVKVVYLKESPSISRLVFTREDYKWKNK